MVFTTLSSRLIGRTDASAEINSPAAGDLSANLAARPALRALPLSYQNEISSLLTERDETMRAEGWTALAGRLVQGEYAEAATEIYSALNATDSPVGAALRERARGRFEAIAGVGSSGLRAEFLGRHLAREASDPAALFGMMGAGLVFRATSLAALSRLAATPAPGFATRLLGARTVANLIGFAAEAPAFTAATRLANAALGREQDWSRPALGRELASGAIVLGSLKLSGALFGAAGRRLLGESATPARRLLQGAFQQSGMFAGILGGHHVEELVGLRAPVDDATVLTDSLATLINFNVGGRLAHHLSGEPTRRWERDMESQAGSLETVAPPHTFSVSLPNFSAVFSRSTLSDILTAPLWMMMGAGGIGGGARGPRRPSSRWNQGRLAHQPLRGATSPHEALVRHFLQQIPEGQRYEFADVAYSLMETYSREAGLPFDVFLGRALRTAPPELASFWLEYLFEPQATSEVAATNPFDWLLAHHVHAGVPWVRRQLAHEQATSRLAAVSVLHHFLGPFAVDDILGLLGDTNLEVRLATQAALIQEGVRAVLPRDHSILAAERHEEFLRTLPESVARGEDAIDRIGMDLFPYLEAAPNSELIDYLRDPSQEVRFRTMAIELLAERKAFEAVVPLREALYEIELREAALEALDGIQPEWDIAYRQLGDTLLGILQRQWSQRFPSVDLQSGGNDSLHRALGTLRSSRKMNLSGTLLALLATGAGLGALLDPATAHASFGNPSGTVSDLWSIGLPLAGALAAVAMAATPGPAAEANAPGDRSIHARPTQILERNRGSNRPSGPPRRPGDPLGYFENFFSALESFPVPDPRGGTAVVGRVGGGRGIFPGEFRQISRRHMEMRERDGIVEVRSIDTAPGLRINQHSLVPRHWYELNDGDLVEFVGLARPEFLRLKNHEDGESERLYPVRSGESALPNNLLLTPPAEQPAFFRFRRSRAPEAPVEEAPRPSLLDLVVSTWKEKFGMTSQPPPAAPPMPPPAVPLAPMGMPPRGPEPIPALRTLPEIMAELGQFHDVARAALHVLEPGLQLEPRPEILADIIQSLRRLHDGMVGGPNRTQSILLKETPDSQFSHLTIHVPVWDGILAQRLAYFEQAIANLPAETTPDSARAAAREHLGRMRDRLERLHEIVRMYRMRYSEPGPLAMLDAMERAYHGLRTERSTPLPRRRHETMGLDALVPPLQRRIYANYFLRDRPPSRAAINMRILFGEISSVRGREIIGEFYRALGSGIGERQVQTYYDRDNGQIVAFFESARRTNRGLEQLIEEGRNLQLVTLVVDALRSGRIIDVTGIPEMEDDSIRMGLEGLRGLQVIPETDSYPPPRPAKPTIPEVVLWERGEGAGTIRGHTERDAAQPGEFWSILLHPPQTTDPADLRRVEAVTPIGGDAVLLTLEGYRPLDERAESDARTGEDSLQLWIDADSLSGLAPGDIVAVSRSREE